MHRRRERLKLVYPGGNVCAGAKGSQQNVCLSMVNVLLTIIQEDLASLYLQNGDAQLTPSPERHQTRGAEALGTRGKPIGPPPRALSSCHEPQLGYSP